MKELTLAFKIIGAAVLFGVTFLFTLLPHKFRSIQAPKLKSITCFCGGLFLGLCFLHLLPDTLREFQNNEKLKKLQDKYPMAELIIIIGLIVVLSAEKMASIIQIKTDTEKKKCDGSENCCKVTCKVQDTNEKTPLISKIERSFVGENKREEENEESFSEEIREDDEKTPIVSDDSLHYQSNKGGRKYRALSTLSTVSQKKKIRIMKIRTICLVIALMVHSLFEGLTVGLQKTKTGVVILVALLTLHKCLVGFSLGIALVNDKSDFSSYQKKAAMFAISSPIGVVIGIILFSTNIGNLSEETVSILTALSTGTFIYVTFFEILRKCLDGDKVQDIVGFLCFILGFGLFAGITSVPALQV